MILDDQYDWAKSLGLLLLITNGGKHWSFYVLPHSIGDAQFAEWWPTTGKLVFQKDWKNSVICKDVATLRNEIESRVQA